MDSSSQRLVDLGCPDTFSLMEPLVTQMTAVPNPHFTPHPSFSNGAYDAVLGPNASEAEKQKLFEYTDAQIKSYTGDEGRLRLQQAAVAMLTRDSLLMRLGYIKCPVLWIAGDKDPIFLEKAARADAALFKSEVHFELLDSYHAPTLSNPEAVRKLLAEFVHKYGGMKDARALREAVGMVDI
jgi:pimeloyl-ACP methyl ester carboxylesterase